MATVRYIVGDVPSAVEFYVNRLGFTVEQAFGAMAIIRRDDLKL